MEVITYLPLETLRLLQEQALLAHRTPTEHLQWLIDRVWRVDTSEQEGLQSGPEES